MVVPGFWNWLGSLQLDERWKQNGFANCTWVMLAVFGRVFKAFEQISSQLKNRYQINKFHIIPAKVTGVYIYIYIYIYIYLCVCVGIVILVSLFLVPLQLILKVKHTTGKNRQGSLEGKKLECSNGVGLAVWIVLPVLPLFQHGEYLLTPTLYPPHWTKKTCAVVAAPTAKKKTRQVCPNTIYKTTHWSFEPPTTWNSNIETKSQKVPFKIVNSNRGNKIWIWGSTACPS